MHQKKWNWVIPLQTVCKNFWRIFATKWRCFGSSPIMALQLWSDNNWQIMSCFEKEGKTIVQVFSFFLFCLIHDSDNSVMEFQQQWVKTWHTQRKFSYFVSAINYGSLKSMNIFSIFKIMNKNLGKLLKTFDNFNFLSTLLSKIIPIVHTHNRITNHNNFFWVCWFLAKSLPNFVKTP